MLGFYTVAALRELGYDTVYCSGNHVRRAEFLKQFGAIPIYNGKTKKRRRHQRMFKISLNLCFFFRKTKYDS